MVERQIEFMAFQHFLANSFCYIFDDFQIFAAIFDMINLKYHQIRQKILFRVPVPPLVEGIKNRIEQNKIGYEYYNPIVFFLLSLIFLPFSPHKNICLQYLLYFITWIRSCNWPRFFMAIFPILKKNPSNNIFLFWIKKI